LTTNDNNLTRRHFLKSSAIAGASILTGCSTIRKRPATTAKDKLNIACIGIGNRGWWAVSEVCDVDDVLVEASMAKAAEAGYPELVKVPRFKDYREMLDRMGDRIDAVTVSTPDHHHYPATMMAIKRGKHVYVEKPLTHTVGEARALSIAARKYNIISQMGNQGHATEGIRLIREWTEAGLLGDVREINAWCPNLGGKYFTWPDKLPPSPETPPANLDWDLWLGPAAECPYSSLYAPRTWRGWWNFGSGMLGDWACHTLDGPFWALKLGAPVSVDVETAPRNEYIVPKWSVVTYTFPARGNMPPVTLKWMEGNDVKPEPPARWKSDRETNDRAMVMIGDKATLMTGGRPDSPILLPDSTFKALKKNPPKKTIPRVKGGPVKEWLRAIKDEGPIPGSSFDYASPLAEMVLLGVLAQRSGKRIEWDSANLKITNEPELNRYINVAPRKGWKV